jgi:hypothetical protein
MYSVVNGNGCSVSEKSPLITISEDTNGRLVVNALQLTTVSTGIAVNTGAVVSSSTTS